jgi:hypothetical protein
MTPSTILPEDKQLSNMEENIQQPLIVSKTKTDCFSEWLNKPYMQKICVCLSLTILVVFVLYVFTLH